MKTPKFILALLGFAALTLAGCGQTNSSAAVTSSASVCDTTDYVAQVHLALDYKGHSFMSDGIGPVVVRENVDGDTTHFNPLLASGNPDTSVLIKSRYLCIDTPESTGQIQPWGKKASKFTAGILNAAKTIVVSSERTDYGLPSADSTGSRYLSYVWYSNEANADYASLKLLNLEIVQNGYSATKSATDSMYASYFYKADAAAQCQQIHIWDPAGDPDYIKTSGTLATLQEIVEGVKWNSDTEVWDTYDWTDATHNKVSVDVTVAKAIWDGGNSAYVYDDIAARGDPTKIVRYGLFAFSGYKNYPPLANVGWRVNLVGFIAVYNGNIQITSLKYSALYTGGDYMTVLDKTGNTYDAPTITGAQSQDPIYNNVVVQLNGLHGISGSGTYASSTGDSFNVHCQDAAGNDTYLRFYKGVVMDRHQSATIIDASTFEAYFCTSGETFNIYGPMSSYTYESSGTTIHQILILVNTDLVFNS